MNAITHHEKANERPVGKELKTDGPIFLAVPTAEVSRIHFGEGGAYG
jgi:hypothetical protein